MRGDSTYSQADQIDHTNYSMPTNQDTVSTQLNKNTSEGFGCCLEGNTAIKVKAGVQPEFFAQFFEDALRLENNEQIKKPLRTAAKVGSQAEQSPIVKARVTTHHGKEVLQPNE